jgi:hypothetical protein
MTKTTPVQKLNKYRQAEKYNVNQGLPNNATIPKYYSAINWNTANLHHTKPQQTGESSDPAGIVTQRTYLRYQRNLIATKARQEAARKLSGKGG